MAVSLWATMGSRWLSPPNEVRPATRGDKIKRSKLLDANGSVRVLPSRQIIIEPGPVDLPDLLEDERGCFGLVVTAGLLLAELEAAHAKTAWLIGAGDVIRPWELDEFSLTRSVRWRALRPARLVRLDRNFYVRSREDPQALNGILSGAVRTGHWLLAKSLIISSPLVAERLLLMFALYGERWGRMTPNGVILELPLTHEMLASLVGARRPSVSHALRSLQRKGLLTCSSRGCWVLHRPPDADLVRGWNEYAAALGFEAVPSAG